MRVNRTKRLLEEGRTVIGSWVVSSDPATTEALADTGLDFVVVDTEHAPQTPLSVQAHMMAVKDTKTTPICRAVWNDFVRVKQLLDLGAEGIVFPWVNGEGDAMLAVSSTRYPPQGMRGWGPKRAVRLAANSDDYYKHANSNVLVLCQIETVEAVENAAEIAEVDGVDGLLIGPADLSISLGAPFEWAGEAFMAAVRKVRAAAEKASKPFGVVTSGAAFAQMWIREGARIVIAGSDAALLRMMAKQTLEEIRGVVGE